MVWSLYKHQGFFGQLKLLNKQNLSYVNKCQVYRRKHYLLVLLELLLLLLLLLHLLRLWVRAGGARTLCERLLGALILELPERVLGVDGTAGVGVGVGVVQEPSACMKKIKL